MLNIRIEYVCVIHVVENNRLNCVLTVFILISIVKK